MFKNLKIAQKFLIYFLLVAIISIFATGYLSYKTAEEALRTQVLSDLSLVAEAKKYHLLDFLKYSQIRAIDFSSDGFIRDSVKDVLISQDKEIIEDLNQHLIKNKITLDKSIYGINILDLHGKVIASTLSSEIGHNESDHIFFTKAKELDYGQSYFGDVVFSHHFEIYTAGFIVASPLTDKKTGEKLGVIVNYIKLDELNKILLSHHQEQVLESTSDLDHVHENTEIYLVDRDGFVISEIDFFKQDILKTKITTQPVIKCRTQEEISDIYSNYRGADVVGVSVCIENGWTLLVEVGQEQAFIGIENIKQKIFLVTVLVFFVVLFLVYFIIRRIVSPIKNITQIAQRISKGDMSGKIKIESGDEIGNLAEAFNKMTDSLVKAIKKAKMSREFNIIFESTKDAIFWIDGSTELIIRCNMAAEDLVKKTRKEIIGKPLEIIFPKEKAKQYIEKFKKHTKSKVSAIEEEIITSSKKIVPVRLSASLVRVEEKFIIQGIFRDITREKEIDKIKTEFISIASHQLRTPLTAIKWFLELLMNDESDKLSEKQRKFCNHMSSSVERIIEFVGDLLEISRIGSEARIGIKKEKKDIIKIIDQAVKDSISLTKNKNVQVIKHINMPEILECDVDENRIRQVFHNLINNAIKYSRDNSNVEIYCKKENSKIEFYVRDYGIGVPQDNEKRVFEKFFRAKNAIEFKTDGSGLGLYIARIIIEEHGGKIWFKSKESIGTTFYFTL